MTGELRFNKDAHEYYIGEKRLVSVSELLSPHFPMPFDGYVDDSIERAAERGTVCHKILEMLLKDDVGDMEYPQEYSEYVSAMSQFIDEHEITPIHIETAFCSERMGIAGTPDLIALFDGKTAIVDYKFVSQLNKTKVGVQLNAYREICEDNGIDIEALCAVHFKSDGTYSLYPADMGDMSDGRLIFNCIMTLNGAIKSAKHPRGGIG